MSRIGRLPVVIPAGVTVDITEDNHVTVKARKEHWRKHFQWRWVSK